ncbi:MAG: precorrin-2 C(20)-methyltransferase [Gemmatales bacterium]|nr:MAG: precorrin-2 C(20)-methyltransferase [Gemmatales bacterium]
MKTPTFYGVGIGPGDPELITLKAARVLEQVDVVLHPQGKHGSFAARILEPLGLTAKLQPISLCMSRQRENDENVYEQTARQIVSRLRDNQSVAWVTQGDPLFYSTFDHLMVAVRRLDPASHIEIIPGVSSLHAASARTGLPLCRLGERVAVVPASYGLDDLPALLERFTTVVLVKVNAVLDRLAEELPRYPHVQAVYVEKAGTTEERIVTDVASLKGQESSYFSLILLRHET